MNVPVIGPAGQPAAATPPRCPALRQRVAAALLAPVRALAAQLRGVARRPGRTVGVAALLGLIGVGVYLAGRQVWASAQLRAGRAALERHHYAEARRRLEACLRVRPDAPEVLLLSARAARRTQDFETADRRLDAYLRLRGEDDDLTVERALVRAERGEVDAVEPFCRALVARNHPATPLALEALTAGYLRSYRLEDAELSLKFWAERLPDDVQALLFRGTIFELRLNPQEALCTYRRAVELDPEFDDARARLAVNLLELVQASEALPHLEYLVSRRPDNPAYRVELARCQAQLGAHDKALELLDEVLARRPDHGPALAERGIQTLQGGRAADAEPFLRRACALMPADYQLHYQWLQCLARLGRAGELRAVQDRLKAIEDDIKRLKDIVTLHMQRAPHNPDLHYELGMIAMRAGNLRDGLRWFESALRHDPVHAPSHQALAGYYQRVGQLGRAARHLEVAGGRRRGVGQSEVPRP